MVELPSIYLIARHQAHELSALARESAATCRRSHNSRCPAFPSIIRLPRTTGDTRECLGSAANECDGCVMR